MAVLLIAKVWSLHLRADCHWSEPSAGFIFGLRAGVGNPQYDWELIAKQLFLLWQTAVLECGVCNTLKSSTCHFKARGPLFEASYIFNFTSLKLIRSILFGPKLYTNGLSWHNISWHYTYKGMYRYIFIRVFLLANQLLWVRCLKLY
jgi:hypothetical protein